MSYSSHGYGINVTKYRGGDSSDGTSSLSTAGKIGFSFAVIVAILISLLVAYCSVSRKHRAVAPDPSLHEAAVHEHAVVDEEQGRGDTTRPAAPVIAS